MSWIDEVEYEEAEGKTKEVYDKIRNQRGKLSNIMKVQSLMPEAMDHHLDLYLSIMFEDRSLSREKCEMIGVVVSSINGCDYCVNHHAEALDHFWRDQEKVKELEEDYRNVDISKKEKNMLGFVKRSTEKPDSVEQKDIDGLIEVGFSDKEILNIVMITSYFNFVNRIALTLGVDFSEEEMKGYDY
ncbi:MAG: peroxidase-related enzyme [Candidatus Thermoplasmatota archaeon]|nr:peroxidase-related enzyme [Candidatus Thermoplasmatota archaeon]MBS3789895.1 peroxidase-related enzyme [Candidatus Thermoplasmatota archaeon]